MPDNVSERIKRWKNKLIDLTKRNRLLNFKPTKVTTIRIVDELPPEILNILALQKEGMEFLPVEAPETNDSLFDNKNEISTSESDISVEFEEHREEDLEEKHGDNFLQTTLTKEILSKNLFRIYSKANSVMEEQGYNVLFLSLGCLEWYESDESDIKLKAPIMLVPVELIRTSVKSKFRMKLHEDEQIIINPALIIKMQNDFSIIIDPIDEELDHIDTVKIFSQIKREISKYSRWRITNDIYLSLFSFAKFIMYKDIEKYFDSLLNSKIIRIVCGQPSENTSLELLVDEKELDRVLVPKNTFQILDADSSQQQAILAAKNGKNLVIEGPPGTGKSQTIANIISEILAEGKKVLFVSQKMAALEVVKKRLDNNGLGDFCLELHSRKANKNEIIKELVRVLEMQQKADHSHDEELDSIDRLRNELGCYVKDIHTPFGKLELTPYQAIGIVNSLLNSENIPFVFNSAKEWDKKRYNDCGKLLDTLAHILTLIGDPDIHPWSGADLTSITYQIKLKVTELLEEIIRNNYEVCSLVERLSRITHFKDPISISEVEILIGVNKFLSEAPILSKAILINKRWDALSPDVIDLIEIIKSLTKLKAQMNPKYDFDKLIAEITDFDAYLNRYKHYSRNPLMFLTALFWKDRKVLRRLLLDEKFKPTIKEIVIDLEKIKECINIVANIKNKNALGNELFGVLWRGKDSDWQLLDNYSKWMVKFRQYVKKDYFTDTIYDNLGQGRQVKDASNLILNSLSAALGKFKGDIKEFEILTKIEQNKVFGNNVDEAPIAKVIEKIDLLKNNIDRIDDWARFQEILGECGTVGLTDYINKIMLAKLSYGSITNNFRVQYLKCWIDEAFSERIGLRRFRGEDHERLIQTFCELDRKQIELAKIRIQHILSGKYDNSHNSSYTPAGNSELGIILREARKTRAHIPIRKLFEQAPNIVMDLKPCLMMSPLTVAQYLNPEQTKIDVVIFDEASQIPPEDAIGSILRGRQVIIAGDSRQLPPTSFFQSELVTLEDEEETDVELLPEDLDSDLPPKKWTLRRVGGSIGAGS